MASLTSGMAQLSMQDKNRVVLFIGSEKEKDHENVTKLQSAKEIVAKMKKLVDEIDEFDIKLPAIISIPTSSIDLEI